MSIHDRIPREIFETILHLCLRPFCPVHDLDNLQLVCRSWRDIIANASFLWSTISVHDGRQAFYKALRMAKNSSLDIIFNDKSRDVESLWPPRSGQKADHWTLEFFTKAGEKIDQWRSLKIYAVNMENGLAYTQTANPPPKLEVLRVESGYEHLEGPGVVLFRGAPVAALKHLKLFRMPINFRSLGSAGLKSLNLEKIPSTTAADIVTTLANSPNLTTLRLAEFGNALFLPNWPATDVPNPSPIHLPFLVDLELADLPPPFLDFLISNLAVPQLRSLQVIDEPPAIVQLLALTTGSLNTILTSVASGARNYQIFLGKPCKITIGGLFFQLNWTSDAMGNLDETFGGLFHHLSELDLAALPLHLTFCNVPVLLDLEWFTRKTNVTSLTFAWKWWRDSAFNTVISLLGQPTPGPSPIWLLPQVEVVKIDLGTTELPRLAAEMIKARHTALPNPGVHGPVPKLFREIWLYYYTDSSNVVPLEEDIITKVAQAAKGAGVHWDVQVKPRGPLPTRFRLGNRPMQNI